MPKLRVLSVTDLVKIFESFGFYVISQKGSHIKLRRITETGEKQTLTVPNHKQLDTSTSKAIFRQASKFISSNKLYTYFYN